VFQIYGFSLKFQFTGSIEIGNAHARMSARVFRSYEYIDEYECATVSALRLD